MITPAIRLGTAPDPAAELGESPAVDHDAGEVWWVDITGRGLHRSGLESGVTASWGLPEEPGFVVQAASGQPIVGMETGLFAFDPHSGSLKKLLDQTRFGHRFNDATVDSTGVLWVSTMARDAARGAGAIWCVSDDLTLLPVAAGLTIPNGMAVDRIRRRLYYSDSHPDVQTIWTASLVGHGEIGKSAVFADMKPMSGRPDGAALDADGRYWIAAVDGAALKVFSPDGEPLSEVALPVTFPTKLAFYGEHCENLVVTSKRDGEHGGGLTFLSCAKENVRGTRQTRWSRQ
ncbi:SMP-30/gluconolactonase/LRE family protein [Hoeflea sp. YIM 152468]|uniref:SMP-30/gluconolactonase/LRE family protein n=1 Tax=Hoeflea sp. YIM 152468 TaxID=3031759 RepID=UPI0023DC56B7|nr:SMP-30/gluconolactonase/LRE family protein [Hoeflea sp. YIM 152468]MDF1606672.1 SMP-30/gluconolactonase/LRE family protein [Hoeflea sp. YIM 152468]